MSVLFTLAELGLEALRETLDFPPVGIDVIDGGVRVAARPLGNKPHEMAQEEVPQPNMKALIDTVKDRYSELMRPCYST